MNIVLSRKGFDASTGRRPSPVLPDGTLLSLPIPETVAGRGVPYADLRVDGTRTYAHVMSDLGISVQVHSHLDPDVDASTRTRLPGWRGLFGQANQAQRHLENRRVGRGDLLLFFGWFRGTRLRDGRLEWIGEDFHALWAYMQIGEIWDLGAVRNAPDWAREHPHVDHGGQYRNSVVYVASDRLSVPGMAARSLRGAGRLRWHDDLRLTAPGRTRSVWRVPAAFLPIGSTPTLSYHRKASRWSRDGGHHVLLKSAGRGQEFVQQASPDLLAWVRSILDAGVPATRDRASMAIT